MLLKTPFEKKSKFDFFIKLVTYILDKNILHVELHRDTKIVLENITGYNFLQMTLQPNFNFFSPNLQIALKIWNLGSIFPKIRRLLL